MGEGTEYQFKKQIYKKIFEDFIGVNNAAVAHGGIDVKTIQFVSVIGYAHEFSLARSRERHSQHQYCVEN